MILYPQVSWSQVETNDEQSDQDEIFYFGQVENGVYKNKSLGLTMNMPKDWYIYKTEDRIKFAEKIKSLNKNLSGISNTDFAKLYLVIANRNKPNSTELFHPNLLVFLIPYKPQEGSTKNATAKEYLMNMKKTLLANNVPIIYPKEIYSKNIGNAKFLVLESKVNYQNVLTFQNQYITEQNGVLLLFQLSYTAIPEGNAMEKALDSIRFEQVQIQPRPMPKPKSPVIQMGINL
jgi:hypothetical protein